MQKQSGQRAGFTMIELLVVIAMIAILMAILLPVFALVRKSVRETTCMNNEHNIGQALTLYHDNWDRYPLAIDAIVVNGVTMRMLFPQYLKAEDALHCPENTYKPTDQNVPAFLPNQVTQAGQAIKEYPNPPNGAPVQLCVAGTRWAIRQQCRNGETAAPVQYPLRDSYDGTLYPQNPSSPYLIHYTLDWTEQLPGPTDNARQLKYRNPPADTVVTWCLNHTTQDSQTGVPHGNVIVLFLDGRVQKIPGERFNPANWGQDGYEALARPK
jgi:prepilin-type N-terminal cleavage/methylation domain-containing protein